MKAIQNFVFAVMIAYGFSAHSSFWEGLPDEVNLLPQKVLIPEGLTSSENAHVTLEGRYPSNCFQKADPQIEINHEQKLIYIKNISHYFKEATCVDMQVDYKIPVNLGLLSAGDFKVILVTADNVNVEYGYLPIR